MGQCVFTYLCLIYKLFYTRLSKCFRADLFQRTWLICAKKSDGVEGHVCSFRFKIGRAINCSLCLNE